MTNDFEAMHDYLGALELELKAKAAHTETRWVRTPQWRRPLVAIVAVSALVIPVIAILASVGGQTEPAYGRPLILKTAAIEIPAPLKDGLALQLAAGPNSALTQARPVTAFGGTAYLLSGENAWCLSAPDPDARRPDAERSVSCTHTKEFLRIGISLVLGNHYIAAIPAGVKNPTLTRADGSNQDLRPDRQGVVVVDALAAGDKVTLHGTDGQTRTDSASGR
jgi:hypothetical protein